MTDRPGHRVAELLARYDSAVLRPPDAAGAPDPAEAALAVPLQRWCLDGAGPGCSPLLRPLSPPAIAQRLRIGALAGDPERAARIANRLSLVLDGSLRLADSGALGRITLKLQTKLHGALWWRPLREDDPWDCGWLQGSTAALQAFQPRRPTLIVAQSPSPAQWQILRERQAGYAHAVRLLIVGTEPPGLAASPWTV